MGVTAEHAPVLLSEVTRLLTECLSDDPNARQAARRTFQAEYGTVIYHFPIKIGGLSVEDAGDFYLYVFEHDRLFHRLRTFEGRNQIHFRTFLSYYVLKAMFLEWLRTQRDIETVSLEAPLHDTQEGEALTLHDILPSAAHEPEEGAGVKETVARQILTTLTSEEQLLLKLLALAESELGSEDLRMLSEISHRPLDEVLALVAEVRDNLTQKDEKYTRLRDELDSTWGWILLRQRDLQQIDETLHLKEQQGDSPACESLRQHRASVEAKITRRLKQRQGLLEEVRALKLTTPYSDVARLLHCPVGTLGARLTRLRKRLVRHFDEEWRRRGEPI
jgi:RNA polymerase sigma factor (sigma-70 family)